MILAVAVTIDLLKQDICAPGQKCIELLRLIIHKNTYMCHTQAEA